MMFYWLKRLFRREQKYYDVQVENFFIELNRITGRDSCGRFTKGNKFAKMRRK
jgi:hypothetical protein